MGCRDPADPPPAPGPADLPRWSTAPHVLWAGPSTPVERPLALFVDQPGGSLDRMLADSDVATFLNDRFTPMFLLPQVAPELPWPSLQILDARGCLLQAAFSPQGPAEIIDAGNRVMRAQAEGAQAQARPRAPARLGVQLPPDHPLLVPCPAP